MRRALKLGRTEPDALDFVLLHGTATDQNDRAEAAAVSRVCPSVPAASFKRLTGHQLAGAGAFGAALACAMLEAGTALPPLNFPDGEALAARDASIPTIALTGPDAGAVDCRRILVNAFAFGGSNVSLLFGRAGEISE